MEDGEMIDIVKKHCISYDDELISDAILEAENFGFENNPCELIAFVNGYIIGIKN